MGPVVFSPGKFSVENAGTQNICTCTVFPKSIMLQNKPFHSEKNILRWHVWALGSADSRNCRVCRGSSSVTGYKLQSLLIFIQELSPATTGFIGLLHVTCLSQSTCNTTHYVYKSLYF